MTIATWAADGSLKALYNFQVFLGKFSGLNAAIAPHVRSTRELRDRSTHCATEEFHAPPR